MQFPTPSRRSLRGFSLIEVIMALGVVAVAIISVLGLIGPTLGTVTDAQNINAGTSCIAKLNSLIQTAPFWSSDANSQGECVWRWITVSAADSPTVFLFYDEIPVSVGAAASTTPLQRVVRFNVKAAGDPINVPLVTFATNANDGTNPQLPLMVKMDSFITAVNQSRVSGPVIAMTVSLSPFVKNFPKQSVAGDETGFYAPPTANNILNGLFPDKPVWGALSTDPDGVASKIPYPEAYLPIYVQAFSIPLSTMPAGADVLGFENSILNSFSINSRLFTYTTAKLR